MSSRISRQRSLWSVSLALTSLLAVSSVTAPAQAAPKPPAKDPVAVGLGGAVTSVDPYATEIGLDVLRRGGNAVDENGVPIPFAEAVTSGLSVGVPGTPATWELALDRWGSIDLRDALRPAARLARRGFVVDETFRRQTADNAV